MLEGVEPRDSEGGVERGRQMPGDLDRRRQGERRHRPGQPEAEPPQDGRFGRRREQPRRQSEEPEHRHDEDQQEVLRHVGGERHLLGPFGQGPEQCAREERGAADECGDLGPRGGRSPAPTAAQRPDA